jgi:hypothetical protein
LAGAAVDPSGWDVPLDLVFLSGVAIPIDFLPKTPAEGCGDFETPDPLPDSRSSVTLSSRKKREVG